MKLLKKQLLIVLVLLMTLLISTASQSIHEAKAADATGGTLVFGFNEYIPGDSYLILATDLDVSSDYTLDFTAGCASQFNFTTGASETQLSHRVILEAPTSGSECLITLEAQSTGTALDTIRLQSTTIASIINQDNLIEIIMLVVVIFLVLGVAIVLFRRISP